MRLIVLKSLNGVLGWAWIGRTNPGRTYTLGEGEPDIVAVEREKGVEVIISSELKPDRMVS